MTSVVHNSLGWCDNKHKVCTKAMAVECGSDATCDETEVEPACCCVAPIGTDS